MLVYHLPGTFETRETQLDLLWEAGATGLEERAGLIRAYFDEQQDLPEVVSDGEWVNEEDQDWQAEFRRTLQPVQAGKITVVAPWQTDQVPEQQIPLVIEPGMAFGTGHHITTRLVIEALSERDLSQCRVLDVGTGSGVLCIASALLGASFSFGLDIDPVTIPIAEENAKENGIAGEKAVFAVGTLGPEAEFSELAEPFDLLVANLYAELHDVLVVEYLEYLRPGAELILTGILTSKEPLVLAALQREGFEKVEVQHEGEWTLITAVVPARENEALM